MDRMDRMVWYRQLLYMFIAYVLIICGGCMRIGSCQLPFVSPLEYLELFICLVFYVDYVK